MKDLTDVISIIKNIKGDITTSDLNNMGLNQYYIKKLIDDGIIDKVGRGTYQWAAKDEESKLMDELINKTKEETNKVVKENGQTNSTSIYIDASKYEVEIAQINSLIQSENFNGLSIYVAGNGYTDQRMLELEIYVLEKMYNKGLFDEAEPFYEDLKTFKDSKTVLDDMLRLRIDSISKKNG